MESFMTKRARQHRNKLAYVLLSRRQAPRLQSSPRHTRHTPRRSRSASPILPCNSTCADIQQCYRPRPHDPPQGKPTPQSTDDRSRRNFLCDGGPQSRRRLLVQRSTPTASLVAQPALQSQYALVSRRINIAQDDQLLHRPFCERPTPIHPLVISVLGRRTRSSRGQLLSFSRRGAPGHNISLSEAGGVDKERYKTWQMPLP